MGLLPGVNYLDRVRAVISAHGWAVQTHRGDDDFSAAYTVGVTTLGAPELLVHGLEPVHAQRLLNHIAPALITGQVGAGDHVAVPDFTEENPGAEVLVSLLPVDPVVTAAPVVHRIYGDAAQVLEIQLHRAPTPEAPEAPEAPED